MPDQIVIEFIGDTSKLTPAIDLVSQLSPELQKPIADFKKMSAESDKATSKISANAKTSIKSFNDIDESVDNLVNTLVDEFAKGAMDALNDAGISAEEFGDAISKAEGKVSTNSKSLKGQLRELKEEISRMDDAGLSTSKRFEELSVKAAKLEDQVGDTGARIRALASDTANVDAAVQGLQVMASGFQLATGAQELFGGESADLQKALVKLNAIMAITSAIQQIQSALQKENILIQKVAILQTKLGNAQKILENGLNSQSVIVRFAAAAAQRVLNAAMAANPAGLVITAVIALIGVFSWLASASDKAAETIAKNNAKLTASADETAKTIEAIGNAGGENIKKLQSQFATEKEIREAQKQILQDQLGQQKEAMDQANRASSNATKALQNRKKLSEDEAKGLKDARDHAREQTLKYVALDRQIKELGYDQEKQDFEDSIKSYTAYQEAKVFQARKGSIAELQAQKEALSARAAQEKTFNVNATAGEKAKAELELQRQLLEIDNQITIKRLENQKFLMEAKLSGIKEGSVLELEERKSIASKSIEIELANLSISDEKKQALREQDAQEQREFDRQIAERRLQSDAVNIEARLARSKQGSKEEFSANIDLLQKQYQLDLLAKGITGEKKLLLEAQYLKQVEQLTKDYSQRVQEEALQQKQAELNTRLSNLQTSAINENNREIIALKKEAVDEQAQLEIIAANNSIQNEELKAAKITEILAKASADKLAIEENYQKSRIDYSEEIYKIETSNEKKRLQLVIQGGSATLNERRVASRELLQIQVDEIDSERDTNLRRYINGVETYEEYLKKKLEIDGKYLDLQLEKEEKQAALRQQIEQAGLEVLSEAISAIFEVNKSKRDAELQNSLAALDAQREKELSNKNLTEQQKEEIQKRFDNRQKQVKKQAAEREKQAQVSQAIINGLLAITKTFASYGFTPAGIIAAAAQAITTAITVSKIRSTQIPGFKKGTKKAPRGYAWVGEEGPEIVHLSGGQKIFRYADSMKVEEAWRGGRQATPEEILALTSPPPAIPNKIISSSFVNAKARMEFDYDKLADAIADRIADAIPDPVTHNLSWDANGFTASVEQAGSRRRYLNNRYSFKK